MKNEKNQLVPITEDFDAKALEAAEKEIQEEGCIQYLTKTFEALEQAQASQDVGYPEAINRYAAIIEFKILYDTAAEHLYKLAEQGMLIGELEVEVIRFKARCKRKLGEILKIIISHKGGRRTKNGTNSGTVFSTLEELGITKKFSSEAQRFALIPETRFEKCLNEEPPNKIFSTLRKITREMSTKKEGSDKGSKRPIFNTKLLSTYFPQLLNFVESNGAPVTPLEDGVQIQHQGERPYILIPRGTTGSHYRLSLKEAQAACRNLDVIREFIKSQSKKEIPHGFRPMKERLIGVFTDNIKKLVSSQVLSEIGGI